MKQLVEATLGTPVKLLSRMPYAQCKAMLISYPDWRAKRSHKRRVGWLGHLVIIWPTLRMDDGPSAWLWITPHRVGTLIRGRASNGSVAFRSASAVGLPLITLGITHWQFQTSGNYWLFLNPVALMAIFVAVNWFLRA